MLVYLINIALILLWGVILLKYKPTEKKKKIYCGIVALQWILISGLRHRSVGADTLVYAESFERAKNISWNAILSNCYNYLFNGFDIKDPGYYLLQKVFQIFSDSYQLFLIFIAVVFIGLMARWIYKYSSMPELSFIVYSVLFYSFFSVTGHRQTLATALIVFLGYEFAKEKKPIKFAVVAFIAFMLHKSSLVFLPYYFIANIAITPIYIGAMAIILIIVVALGETLYAPIAFLFGFEEEQIFYEGGGTETFVLLMVAVCIVSFALYPWIQKRREDTSNIYSMVYLTLLTTLLVAQQQSFMRIQQYYSLIIMITIPEMVLSVKKEYRVFVYFVGVIVMLLFLISKRPYYMFFWQ